MLVQCECGQEVDVKIPRLVYAPPEHETIPTPMAGKKCPNPQCNKTIYIQSDVTITMANSQYIQDTNINWHKSRVRDILYFRGYPYEIAFKEVRTVRKNVIPNKPILILYLRSISGKDNLVTDVREDNSLGIMEVDERESGTAWHETWTEDQLRKIFDNRVGLL
ncbi:MAG: hypothetical protein KAS66_05970 [Candidatus Omnitrophica bacterium]|nr:hypothetical protein [Candidatus Omnitrophota bacterium]